MPSCVSLGVFYLPLPSVHYLLSLFLMSVFFQVQRAWGRENLTVSIPSFLSTSLFPFSSAFLSVLTSHKPSPLNVLSSPPPCYTISTGSLVYSSPFCSLHLYILSSCSYSLLHILISFTKLPSCFSPCWGSHILIRIYFSFISLRVLPFCFLSLLFPTSILNSFKQFSVQVIHSSFLDHIINCPQHLPKLLTPLYIPNN